MTFQELKEQVSQLPVSERLELITAIVQSLSSNQTESWQYLVSRPHPWRKQLYIKGRKLLASTIWQDQKVNSMTAEQASENWDLPISAIYEAIQYCESHQDLIKLEADEEGYRLETRGASLESQTVA